MIGSGMVVEGEASGSTGRSAAPNSSDKLIPMIGRETISSEAKQMKTLTRCDHPRVNRIADPRVGDRGKV